MKEKIKIWRINWLPLFLILWMFAVESLLLQHILGWKDFIFDQQSYLILIFAQFFMFLIITYLLKLWFNTEIFKNYEVDAEKVENDE